MPGDDPPPNNAGAAYVFLLGGTDCNGNNVADECEIAEGTLGDIDADGNVDLQDGDALVAVLLGAPMDPAHVLRSDLNCDGLENGLDISVFIGIITGG